MKISFFLVLTGLLLFSCKKSEEGSTSSSLEGTWKMILVKDNASTISITKPGSIQNDVIISFSTSSSSTGYFSGKTPTNTIGQSSYALAANQSISIPSMVMTKVAETTWGAEFVDHIREARQYNFPASGKLEIITLHKTLTFQKQ